MHGFFPHLFVFVKRLKIESWNVCITAPNPLRLTGSGHNPNSPAGEPVARLNEWRKLFGLSLFRCWTREFFGSVSRRRALRCR
jgi:hypothetical protein